MNEDEHVAVIALIVKARRKRIREALDLLQQACEIIAEVGDEEEEAFDNLPESIQESERGEKMQEYIDTINEVLGAVDEVKDNLETILEG